MAIAHAPKLFCEEVESPLYNGPHTMQFCNKPYACISILYPRSVKIPDLSKCHQY